MRIAIFGAGGAGGYFGARLAKAGEDVVWIARGAHLEALRTRGLRVESIDGDFQLGPLPASDDPSVFGSVDAILFGVKVWQVPEAAAALRPLLGADTFVVPLQNGVEAAGEIGAVLGPERAVAGIAKIFCFLVGPGHLRRPGGPAAITFGELDNRRTDRLERLRAALQRAGLGAEIPADINVALWEKFLFVASGGGLGAVTRAPIGIVRSVPETRALLVAAMEEIRNVGRARGVRLSDDVVERTMAFVDTLPIAGTASLQRDLAAGRRSELDWWSGSVVRLGAEAGVATPIHSFIYRSLLPTELRARGAITFPPEA
jgi:2-dehydropantoate 2-reductase